MRIPLDESVPQKLRLLIEGHSVVTAWFQGWSGLTNGALLNAAEQAGFDVCITADQEIRYQQNLAGRKLALLVLSTNNWDAIKTHVAAILAALDVMKPGSYNVVKFRSINSASRPYCTYAKYRPVGDDLKPACTGLRGPPLRSEVAPPLIVSFFARR